MDSDLSCGTLQMLVNKVDCAGRNMPLSLTIGSKTIYYLMANQWCLRLEFGVEDMSSSIPWVFKSLGLENWGRLSTNLSTWEVSFSWFGRIIKTMSSNNSNASVGMLILFTCTFWVLSGNALLVKDKPTKKFYIKIDTIKGYLRKINKYYIENSKPAPYNTCIKTRAVRLLDKQEKMK